MAEDGPGKVGHDVEDAIADSEMDGIGVNCEGSHGQVGHRAPIQG